MSFEQGIKHITFEASILVDGEREMTITANSIESLEEEMYKLEFAQDKLEKKGWEEIMNEVEHE